MTDVHCHVSANDNRVREFLIGRDFFGIHPWECDRRDVGRYQVPPDSEAHTGNFVGTDPKVVGNFVGTDHKVVGSGRCPIGHIRQLLIEHPNAGVGEIGLDRLKNKQISPLMREMFVKQLQLAHELNRPVVLHGAKCWGEVVRTVSALGTDPKITYLFHGFSRSAGLIPEIERLNGFISVGPAVLNSHAVNYRELVRQIPKRMLLVETDRTETSAAECPGIERIIDELAGLRGMTFSELEQLTDENARRFFSS